MLSHKLFKINGACLNQNVIGVRNVTLEFIILDFFLAFLIVHILGERFQERNILTNQLVYLDTLLLAIWQSDLGFKLNTLTSRFDFGH